MLKCDTIFKGVFMQISVSIEPYLGVEKVKLIQYIESVVNLSKKLGRNNVSLHFDYFKSNPKIFNLVQNYANQIDIDLHLMKEPVPSVDKFRSVSYEIDDLQKSDNKILDNLQLVETKRRGLYLDLGAEIKGCEDLISSVSYIIIMTVKCGKSGQTFQSSALNLITQVRKLNPKVTIIVDGGVNENNVQLLKDAGVNVAVVGSYAKNCYENNDFLNGINRLLHD